MKGIGIIGLLLVVLVIAYLNLKNTDEKLQTDSTQNHIELVQQELDQSIELNTQNLRNALDQQKH